jgi:hypothetical protein
VTKHKVVGTSFAFKTSRRENLGDRSEESIFEGTVNIHEGGRGIKLCI